MINTETKRNPWIFALYYIPGLVYLFINTTFAPRLAQVLNLDLWATQMYIVVGVLWIPMLFITYFYLKYVDELTFKQMIDWLGLNRFSWKNMVWALVLFVPFIGLLGFVWIPYIGKPLTQFLETIPLISMPTWFWQNTMQVSLKTLPLAVTLVPLSLVIIFNHVGEEIYFRGLLFQKTEAFFGKWTPVIAGLLFITYHTFQLSKTLPIFPTGIFLASFYYWKRDIYSVIFLHLLINLMSLL
ncbi:MAG: CPBP family intramembrane glutamic endopeptidase [Chloroflexota bacterium]